MRETMPGFFEVGGEVPGRLDANLELALLGVEELDDAGGDLDLMGGQKPALRAPRKPPTRRRCARPTP